MSKSKRPPPAAPPEATSLRDLAYTRIRDAIVDGTFEPGRQIGERDLSARFGISTTPIKEALRRLESESLILTVPRRGTFVTHFTPDSFYEAIITRAAIEGVIARIAATKATPEHAVALRDVVQQMRRAVVADDLPAFIDENERFHGMIHAIADNPFVATLTKSARVYEHVVRQRLLKQTGSYRQTQRDHAKIAEAIIAHDAALAESTMRRHIEHGWERFVAASRPSRQSRTRFLAAAGAAFATVGFVRSPARAAQFEYKCGSNYALEHPATVRAIQLWSAVERESGGRLRVQHFPNSQLGGDTAMFTQLRSGALQFQMLAPNIVQSVVPVASISDVGYAFKNETMAVGAFDGPLGAYVRREIDTAGIHALTSIWDSGMREITTSVRPIRTVDDLAGLKLRTPPAKLYVELFKTLGATPTPINFNEVYTALQTKIVDGQETPLITIEVSRLFEVQKYLSMTNHLWAGVWMLANGEAWKALPPGLQAIVDRNNTKYALLERRDAIVQNAAVADKLRRQGLALNQPDPGPFRARLAAYYKAWEKEFGPTAWGLLETAIGAKLG